jgi:hypothetical protein
MITKSEFENLKPGDMFVFIPDSNWGMVIENVSATYSSFREVEIKWQLHNYSHIFRWSTFEVKAEKYRIITDPKEQLILKMKYPDGPYYD